MYCTLRGGCLYELRFSSKCKQVFDIHMSVHRNIIPNYNEQMQRFLIYLFLQNLYMFQAVPPLIIRNT